MGKGSRLARVMKEISSIPNTKVVAFVRPKESSFLEECLQEANVQRIPILDHHERVYDLLKKPLVLSMYYDRILSTDFCETFIAANLHNSLLPKYRGVRPIEYALKYGEEEVGATLHLIDGGIDTGPIISQKRIQINDGDSASSLRIELANLGAEMLIDFVRQFPNYEVEIQDESTASYFSKRDAVRDGLW